VPLNELEDYKPLLVVNSKLSTGTQFRLQLSNSASVSNDNQPKLVKDAVISIAQNGTSFNMTYDAGTELYTSGMTPQPGDIILLDIRAQGYPIATSSASLPKSISAVTTLVPEGGVDSLGNLSDLIKIRFHDDPSEKNYYLINFYYYDNTLGQFFPMPYSANDPALAQYNSFKLNNGSILFDDELFNGKSKVISTLAPFGLVIGNPNAKYLVQLESISESYYKYLSSLQRAKDAKEGTFSSAFNNAVVIYSNINNGLGILGASYAVRDTLY
jgi:hypothetical protein